MSDAAEKIEDMSETELAEARGDNYDPEQASEVTEEVTEEVNEETSTEKTPEEASSEEAPVAEAEVKEEASEPDEAPQPVRPLMMPKSRYDAMRSRLTDAEKQNEDLRKQLEEREINAQQATSAPAQDSLESKIAELDVSIAEALKDGDSDVVVKHLAEQRSLQAQMYNAALAQTANTTTTATRAQVEYDALLNRVETKIPVLVPDNEGYDEALVTEIADLAGAFESRGRTPADALERALGYVFPQGWESYGSEVSDIKAATRKTDVQKNIETAKKQPPRLDKGEDSSKAGKDAKIDIFKLSDEEFDKLTEQQLSELRGDAG